MVVELENAKAQIREMTELSQAWRQALSNDLAQCRYLILYWQKQCEARDAEISRLRMDIKEIKGLAGDLLEHTDDPDFYESPVPITPNDVMESSPGRIEEISEEDDDCNCYECLSSEEDNGDEEFLP